VIFGSCFIGKEGLFMVDVKELTETVKKAIEATPKRNFLESVDVAINLKDIDLKDTSKRFNIEVLLPNPPGKEVKIGAVADPSLEVATKKAGFNTVLTKDDVEKLVSNPKQAKKIARENDFFIASPSLMPFIGRSLGKFLGPRGKMPKPVPPTTDVEALLDQYKRTVRLRLRDTLVLNARVGTVDMDPAKIAENIMIVIEALERKLEHGMNNIKAIIVKTTMGSPTKIDLKT